jgi:hypothetical protein
VSAGLDGATFEQRRKLVELLVDRVIVTDEEVEIRYVIPTSLESEHVRFCHLRSDYFNYPPLRQHLETLALKIPLDDLQFPSALLLAFIHSSAWKSNSRKFTSSIMHSPVLYSRLSYVESRGLIAWHT